MVYERPFLRRYVIPGMLPGMAKEPSKRAVSFAAWMSARELNPSRVSKEAKVPYTTLASFVQGDTRSLKGDTESKIALAYDTTVAEVFESAAPSGRRTIPIVGYVGAATEFHGFDDYAQGAGLEEIDRPSDAPAHAVAVIVRGDSGYPFIRDGMTLIYWDKHPDPTSMIGEACFVRLLDGRTLVKFVEPGTEPGRWTLNSLNSSAPPIRNVEVEWVAPIETFNRRRNWRAA